MGLLPLPSLQAVLDATKHLSIIRRYTGAIVLATFAGAGCAAASLLAQPFHFPTANHTLLQSDGGQKFYVGTTGKPWTSGMFGCVRSGGQQMHEGLDIRCLERDKKGEPTDPVLATADGTVVYRNDTVALSNYGKYIILRHRIDGLEVYSTYAHLSRIRPDLTPGAKVVAGQPIATMGRTSNTREPISKERAHVHFEIGFFVNDQFAAWYKRNFPDQRNDHGAWNGQNLLGLDPSLILLAQAKNGARFNFLDFVRKQTELCRVIVRVNRFPWLHRYPRLVRRNPRAEKEGIAGFEIALNYNGVPFELVPRAPSEIQSEARFQLISVNESQAQMQSCRQLVLRKPGRWELGSGGLRLLDLLTF